MPGPTLERDNALLQAALESVTEAVAVADPQGRLGFCNTALTRLLGSRSVTTLPELITALFTEPLGLHEAVALGVPWEGRLSHQSHPGDPIRWFAARLRPAPGASGLLLTLSDATEAVERERLEKVTTDGTLAKAAVAWAISMDYPFPMRCNVALNTVNDLTGGRAAIFLNRPESDTPVLTHSSGEFVEPLPPEHPGCGRLCDGVRTLVVDLCAEGGEAHGHYVVPLLEQPGYPLGYLLVRTGPAPMRDAVAALEAIAEILTIAVVRDRAEQLLHTSKASAEGANRAKSDFLATMSHEIRTPMNGILGFSELLLEAPMPEDQRAQVRLIRNSAEALLTVINDVLDYSKIEAGKFTIEARPMNLLEASREPLELLRDAARRKGLTLELTMGEGLPRTCLMDPQRYRQVLLNLIGNAVKFTARGEVRVKVGLTEGPQRALRVEVSDTGIGISAEGLPRLFEKFVQADSSTSRRFGGTGLGLAISKKLVELMGGVMGATSELAVGSTFWFELPAVVASEPSAGPLVLRPQAGGLRQRVLVAEDNKVNQLLARSILERLGCEVVLAVNGLEAVERACTEPFDVVLMDCQMPELDGLGATQAIRAWEQRERRSPLLIIALTANAFPEDVSQCLAVGMDSVITKPFKPAQLAAVLSAKGLSKAS